MKNFEVIKHALLEDKLASLRKKDTSTQDFRRLISEISAILAVSATANCDLKEEIIETPMEKMSGKRLAKSSVVIPILRAGLGMVEGFLNILPKAKVGHLGVYRDEATLKPKAYYENFPTGLDKAEVFILDPMLATGGSAVHGISHIKKKGAKDITLVTIISAPEGVELVTKEHPDIKVITSYLDRELNNKGYILPGLGDAGDRLYGTL